MDNRIGIPIVAFNLTFFLFQFVFNWGYFGHPFTWLKLFLAFLLGAAAAGAAFGAMATMKK